MRVTVERYDGIERTYEVESITEDMGNPMYTYHRCGSPLIDATVLCDDCLQAKREKGCGSYIRYEIPGVETKYITFADGTSLLINNILSVEGQVDQ